MKDGPKTPLDAVTELCMWSLIVSTGDRLLARGKLRMRVRELIERAYTSGIRDSNPGWFDDEGSP